MSEKLCCFSSITALNAIKSTEINSEQLLASCLGRTSLDTESRDVFTSCLNGHPASIIACTEEVQCRHEKSTGVPGEQCSTGTPKAE